MEEPEHSSAVNKRARFDANQEIQARPSAKKRGKKRRRKGPLATFGNRAEDGEEDEEDEGENDTEAGPVTVAKRETKKEEDTEATAALVRSPKRGKSADAKSRPPSPPQESSEVIIARLKTQIAEQQQLLDRQTTTIQSVTSSMTCQVCLDYLQKPFALAPCGHIACYSCLKSWFTAGAGPGPDHIHKRKTCPHCRAVIRERPVEVWVVKDAAAILMKADRAAQPQLAIVAADDAPPATVPDDADPWQHIFRPVWRPRDPVDHHVADDVDEQNLGMFDAEDSVYRCFDCMHEIWSGECTNCHREYPGHRLDEDDDDEADFFPFPRLFDFFPVGDEDDMTDDEDDGHDGPPPYDFESAHGSDVGEYEDEEEGHGDGHVEGIFDVPSVIDVSSGDEDDELPVPARRRRPLYVDSDSENEVEDHPPPAEVIEIQDDEDEGLDDEGEGAMPHWPVPERSPDPYAHIAEGDFIAEDQLHDDDDSQPLFLPGDYARRGHNHLRQRAYEESEEDEDGSQDEHEALHGDYYNGDSYSDDEDNY